MLGLWSEALALDHAGLGDEGTRFRDDALALAQATEPALLPRLGAQRRPVVGPPPPPRPDPDLPPWTCLAGRSDPICVALAPCLDALLAAREVSIAVDPSLPQAEFDALLRERFATRDLASSEASRACVVVGGPPALRAAALAAQGLVAADAADAIEASTVPPFLSDPERDARRVLLGYTAADERRTAGTYFARAALLVPGEYAERGAELKAARALTEQAVAQELIRDSLARFGQPVPPPVEGEDR